MTPLIRADTYIGAWQVRLCFFPGAFDANEAIETKKIPDAFDFG